MSEAPTENQCVWQQDMTLQSIRGFHMTCLKPAGATRVFSGNASGFKFCPYCGQPLVIADSPEALNG